MAMKLPRTKDEAKIKAYDCLLAGYCGAPPTEEQALRKKIKGETLVELIGRYYGVDIKYYKRRLKNIDKMLTGQLAQDYPLAKAELEGEKDAIEWFFKLGIYKVEIEGEIS